MNQNDQYGHWTDPTFEPHHSLPGPRQRKKSLTMRWLDPEWSIVKWVRSMFTEETDEELNHHHRHDDPHFHAGAGGHHPHANGLASNEFQKNRQVPAELPDVT